MFQTILPRTATSRKANAVPQVLDHEVSNAELKNDIQMLAMRMSNKNNRVQDPVDSNGGSVAARVHDIVRINLSKLIGSQTGENPQISLMISRRYFR